jgi:polyhydroxyalkanoate synthesis regulator phasin
MTTGAYATIRDQVQKLQQELHAQGGAVESLKGSMELVQQQQAEQTKALQHQTKALQQQLQSLAATNSTPSHASPSEVNAVKQQLTALQGQQAAADALYSKLQLDLQRYQQEEADHQMQLQQREQQAVKEAITQMASQLHEQVARALQVALDVQTQQQKQEVRISLIEEQLQDGGSPTGQAVVDMDAVLQRDVARLCQRLSAVQDEQLTYMEHLQELQRQGRQQQSSSKELQLEVERLFQQIAAVQEQLGECADQLGSCALQLQGPREEDEQQLRSLVLEQMEHVLSPLLQQLQRVQEVQDTYKSTLQKLQKEDSCMDMQVSEAQVDIAGLMVQLEAMQQHQTECLEQVAELQKGLQQLQQLVAGGAGNQQEVEMGVLREELIRLKQCVMQQVADQEEERHSRRGSDTQQLQIDCQARQRRSSTGSLELPNAVKLSQGHQQLQEQPSSRSVSREASLAGVSGRATPPFCSTDVGLQDLAKQLAAVQGDLAGQGKQLEEVQRQQEAHQTLVLDWQEEVTALQIKVGELLLEQESRDKVGQTGAGSWIVDNDLQHSAMPSNLCTLQVLQKVFVMAMLMLTGCCIIR